MNSSLAIFLTAILTHIVIVALVLLHEDREDRRTNLMLRPTVAVYGGDR